MFKEFHFVETVTFYRKIQFLLRTAAASGLTWLPCSLPQQEAVHLLSSYITHYPTHWVETEAATCKLN